MNELNTCTECGKTTNQPLTDFYFDGELFNEGPLCRECYAKLHQLALTNESYKNGKHSDK